MANRDEIPQTTPAEVENLIKQLRATNLDPGSKDKIERLLRTVLTLVELLQRRNTSIKKLREMIFGWRTEKRHLKKPNGEGKKNESEAGEKGSLEATANPGPEREQSTMGPEATPCRKGHGHRAVAEFGGARKVPCRHKQLKAGDNCPSSLCGGRLYDLREPTMLLQFTGSPLITATNYEREVLRCAKCQDRYVAPLPESVQEERYDASCDATIAVMKYGGGLPWHRQSELQSMAEIPLSVSTMWERCEATANAALGVYLSLMRQAAAGEVMHTDDTRVRILSCLKEDKQRKGRATQTSGIVSISGERRIALYFSGRRHAGENLAELLKLRAEELTLPIQMSDALAANTSQENDVMTSYCLAHARRVIYELKDLYPTECEVVLAVVGKVYRHEMEAADLNLEQRLAYHREKSGPVMAELKAWMETQFSERLVEPNSSFGGALNYWLNRWDELTVWLRVPGSPLDNNQCERALKQFILMRKNSLFFKTEHGAAIGDILASLIQTCRLNGINAWDYLMTIIRNKSDARRNPQRYLPWNYREDEGRETVAA
jgi:transposase